MILFISDLHLCPQTPGLRALFSFFLTGPAQSAEAVYILGDLFDVWVGDEMVVDPWYSDIVSMIKGFVGQKRKIFVLHGNRDFLLGSRFAKESGATLLPDPFILSIPTWQFVLTHGDILCTDDINYQQFRQQTRNPNWQREFLALPLAERIKMAEGVRTQSQIEKNQKANTMMDVNAGTVDDFLRANGYATLIHGHTHRAKQHDHIVDGIHCQRWVLSDWREYENKACGDYLCWNGNEITRQSLDMTINK